MSGSRTNPSDLNKKSCQQTPPRTPPSALDQAFLGGRYGSPYQPQPQYQKDMADFEKRFDAFTSKHFGAPPVPPPYSPGRDKLELEMRNELRDKQFNYFAKEDGATPPSPINQYDVYFDSSGTEGSYCSCFDGSGGSSIGSQSGSQVNVPPGSPAAAAKPPKPKVSEPKREYVDIPQYHAPKDPTRTQSRKLKRQLKKGPIYKDEQGHYQNCPKWVDPTKKKKKLVDLSKVKSAVQRVGSDIRWSIPDIIGRSTPPRQQQAPRVLSFSTPENNRPSYGNIQPNRSFNTPMTPPTPPNAVYQNFSYSTPVHAGYQPQSPNWNMTPPLMGSVYAPSVSLNQTGSGAWGSQSFMTSSKSSCQCPPPEPEDTSCHCPPPEPEPDQSCYCPPPEPEPDGSCYCPPPPEPEPDTSCYCPPPEPEPDLSCYCPPPEPEPDLSCYCPPPEPEPDGSCQCPQPEPEPEPDLSCYCPPPEPEPDLSCHCPPPEPPLPCGPPPPPEDNSCKCPPPEPPLPCGPPPPEDKSCHCKPPSTLQFNACDSDFEDDDDVDEPPDEDCTCCICANKKISFSSLDCSCDSTASLLLNTKRSSQIIDPQLTRSNHSFRDNSRQFQTPSRIQDTNVRRSVSRNLLPTSSNKGVNVRSNSNTLIQTSSNKGVNVNVKTMSNKVISSSGRGEPPNYTIAGSQTKFTGSIELIPTSTKNSLNATSSTRGTSTTKSKGSQQLQPLKSCLSNKGFSHSENDQMGDISCSTQTCANLSVSFQEIPKTFSDNHNSTQDSGCSTDSCPQKDGDTQTRTNSSTSCPAEVKEAQSNTSNCQCKLLQEEKHECASNISVPNIYPISTSTSMPTCPAREEPDTNVNSNCQEVGSQCEANNKEQ